MLKITTTATVEEILRCIEKAEGADDFLNIQCKISDFFALNTESATKEVLQNNFYITAAYQILKNKSFLESLKKVAEQYKSFKKNYEGDSFWKDFENIEVKNKKLIYAALSTSTAILANILTSLRSKNIEYSARFLSSNLRALRTSLEEQYSFEQIYHSLNKVFSRKFYERNKILNVSNFSHFSQQQNVSSYIISSAIEGSFRHSLFCSMFKAIERNKGEGKFSLISIDKISRFIYTQKNTEKRSLEKLQSLQVEKSIFELFFKNLEFDNERHSFNLTELILVEFLKIMPKEKGVYVTKKKSIKEVEKNLRDLRTEAAAKMISEADIIQKRLRDYGKENFKAFSGRVAEDDSEWSNKIFIKNYEFIGVLSGISEAVDEDWKINVVTKEALDWTGHIHRILNKYDIEDDWEKIANILNQETNRVEWKSTFFTPIEMSKNDEKFQFVSKKIISGIIKTILAMINTEGGTILIGLVENPEQIVMEDIKNKVLKKKNRSFFDVSYELEENKMDLDSLKRRIQDLLKKETMLSVDNFNNLWNIEPIKINSDDGIRDTTIFKINISKSERPIFSIKSDQEGTASTENLWISLLKRADARTIRVDPRVVFTF